MNIVIYARFSSHSQTEQSIEGQLKVCYEYAEANHYTVVGEYIDAAVIIGLKTLRLKKCQKHAAF